MPPLAFKLPARSLVRHLRRLYPSAAMRPLSSGPPAAAEARTQKLERIADEILSLSQTEREDYSILFRLKLGLNQFVPPAGGGLPVGGAGSGGAAGEAEAIEEAKEKTAFDIKLEKFDAAAKIKIIKEVRTFTDLGLKEAKELVEKAPVVVKKGVTKEEADAIFAKLKEAGATVTLE